MMLQDRKVAPYDNIDEKCREKSFTCAFSVSYRHYSNIVLVAFCFTAFWQRQCVPRSGFVHQNIWKGST